MSRRVRRPSHARAAGRGRAADEILELRWSIPRWEAAHFSSQPVDIAGAYERALVDEDAARKPISTAPSAQTSGASSPNAVSPAWT
jgi:hypothetical protein